MKFGERLSAVHVQTPWGFWIRFQENIIAGVIRANFRSGGPSFVTPDEFGLQVAVMERPKGYSIPSHEHLAVPRATVGTQEVLLIRQGTMRADLFSQGREYLVSVELGPGDAIILNSGGHGFYASEDCLFIEVKQGPFVEGKDKEIFPNTVGSETPIRLIE
jgi:hypothetical protein